MKHLLSSALFIAACSHATHSKPPPANPEAGQGVPDFREPYASITECLQAWAPRRDDFERRWGPSWGHDGDANWNSARETSTLQCSPLPDGTALLQFTTRTTQKPPRHHGA
jgi:hypothetical protein